MRDSENQKEKNWKLLYLRSEKVKRAKQLGFDYPRKDLISKESTSANVLFICSRNKWRSPTAEKIYSKNPLILTKSCGTSKNATTTVNSALLKWADIIFCMEEKHRSRLVSNFPGETRYKEIHVLGIPDDYKFMDEELISELFGCVDPLLYQREA